jgi:predicted PurR-regulated permease PerM
MLKRSTEGRSLEHVVTVIAIRVLCLTGAFVIFVLLAWRLRLILLIILVSLFIAALLNPGVHLLTKRGLKRTPAVLVIYLVLIGLVLGIGYTFFNTVLNQATHFAHVLPSLVRQAQSGKGAVGHLIKRFHLASYVAAHSSALASEVSRLGRPALAVGKTVFSGLTSLLTIMFLSFFILLEAPKIMKGILGFLPDDRAGIAREIMTQMTHKVTGFMFGDLLTSIIAGIVSYVVLRVTGVPFAGVLAIWTALVDFLPLVGGLLAAIPTVGVAFLHSTSAGVITLIVFLIYQQIENHILNPVIISRTLRLNPLWVLLSVILGAEIGSIVGSTFGAICGAILALPTAGAIQVAFHEMEREGLLAWKRRSTGPQVEPEPE